MSLDLGGPAKLSEPVTGADQLVAFLRAAEKPHAAWRVGVEHEKLGLRGQQEPLPYEGEGGIRALLEGLARESGSAWRTHREDGNPIALLGEGSSVTLEPGGQLELSGAPFARLRDADAEARRHLDEVRRYSAPRGIRWLAAGYRPFGAREEMPWMPKLRYQAMRRSLGPQGRLALDMMLMTATVQANLDWSDEADLAAKVCAATSASPAVTAIFANSPFQSGRPSGLLDFRYQVWRETDPSRCGLLPIMASLDFSYLKYVEWALDVPLLFVRHEGQYLDARSQTFRQWMQREEAAGLRGPPTMLNWSEHLTTLFPEVRVKSVLELRGADAVPMPLLFALPAIWVGLLYDAQSRQAAIELTGRWTFAERLAFQGEVARHALDARGPGGVTARELGRELLALARAGLGRMGEDVALLDPADEVVESGRTYAQRALEAWETSGGDPEALVQLWQIS
jgi:glutamate--cysteine ligase